MSDLVLGTAQFGMDYGVNNPRGMVPEEEVAEILRLAIENGITFLDTAYLYGESEIVLGRIFTRTGMSFKVVSKLPQVKSPKEVGFYLEDSLRRLQIESLYGYLVHDFKNWLRYPDLWSEMLYFKEKEKVLKIGFSLYHPSEVETILEKGIKPDLLQVPLSILDQRFMPFLSTLSALDIEIHARSVFLQGLVFKDPASLPPEFEPLAKNLSKIRSIARKENLPLEAIFLGFVLETPGVSKIVIGVDGLPHLKGLLNIIPLRSRVRPLRDELLPLSISRSELILPYLWPKKLLLRALKARQIIGSVPIFRPEK